MKKIFTSVAIVAFGFSTLSAQLRTSHHESQENKITGSNVSFTQLHPGQSAKIYSIAGATKLNTIGNLTLAAPAETSNFFRRWLADGSVQTSRNMTMAFSFEDDVNNISILFLLPIKKIKFL